MDGTDKTDTAEPAAAVAKRIPGADWEPGPDSPLNDDGSPKVSATDAARRWAKARQAEYDREAVKRSWAGRWQW